MGASKTIFRRLYFWLDCSLLWLGRAIGGEVAELGGWLPRTAYDVTGRDPPEKLAGVEVKSRNLYDEDDPNFPAAVHRLRSDTSPRGSRRSTGAALCVGTAELAASIASPLPFSTGSELPGSMFCAPRFHRIPFFSLDFLP